ncbi:unnamed protein product [Protopolystoma xenopodis]|uniref:Uncharacterized protein n=1 Tax=Protopolystoma xenopodis TaxID=117903 RepID=A0A448WEP7_9PLAT|nr:unnamed protein product [Protopolystoma xenopodis]
MVDHCRSRHVKTGNVLEEIVLRIHQNWWRTHFIALVANGVYKRWIIATVNMKVGDIVRSHIDIPHIPVVPIEGDAYPIGALPAGTTICQIEAQPGQGALYCTAAGTSGLLVRRGSRISLEKSEGQTSSETDSSLAPSNHDPKDEPEHRVLNLPGECALILFSFLN